MILLRKGRPVHVGGCAPFVASDELFLARQYMQAMADPPAFTNRRGAVKAAIGKLLNDSLGDCVVAAYLHWLMLWAWNAGIPLIAADADALAIYRAAGGYDPADPSTDQGMDIQAMLSWARANTVLGFRLGASAYIDPRNLRALRQAIAFLEGVDVGLNLCPAWLDQDIWDVGSGPDYQPRPDYGHSVVLPDYNADGNFVVWTWGEEVVMTPAALQLAVRQAFMGVSQAELNVEGLNAAGLNIAQINADLSALRG
jgi:hypothetical protein